MTGEMAFVYCRQYRASQSRTQQKSLGTLYELANKDGF